jgi:hypothetical protein
MTQACSREHHPSGDQLRFSDRRVIIRASTPTEAEEPLVNRWIVTFAATSLLFVDAAAADDGAEFFEAKVRPLLADHCYPCHAGDKARGGLLLDSAETLRKGGDSGPSLVPGKPDESLLVRAIRREDDVAAMPPEEDEPLSADEVAILVEWVRRGAPDPRQTPIKLGGMTEQEARSWWSFGPLKEVRPPEPQTADPGQAGNPIDRFLLSALNSAGLKPSPEADRRTWIRRVTYDLTGLPPTPEEVAAFIADPSAEAHARFVDRLLESPQYGEHWARHWFDVVRYADTAGENTDRPLPEMWRYRNWVIDSLNRDIPMDEFVQMQIAGDLLRKGAAGDEFSAGVIATGYLALARRFGHDIDQDKHLMYEDVIDNIGKAFLGLTLSCARCHDHKYDPFSKEDYYAIYGILDSSRFAFSGCEAKGAPRDLVPLLSPADIEALKRPWREARERYDVEIRDSDSELQELQAQWRKILGDAKQSLAAIDIPEAGSVHLTDAPNAKLDSVSLRRGEILLLVVAPRGGHGADTTQVRWEITELEGAKRRWSTDDLVETFPTTNPFRESAESALWHLLDFHAEPVHLGERLDGHQDQPAIKVWRRGDTPSVLANTSDKPIKVWTELAAKSFFVHPGQQGPVAIAWAAPHDTTVSIRGEIRDAHPAPGLDGVAISIDHLADPLAGQTLERVAEIVQLREKLRRQRDAASGPEPQVPMAFSVTEAEAHDAYVHIQGDPEKKGANVPRRWLEIFGGQTLPPGAGSGRAELAQWIASHPLASRVMVNRVWQGHFGRGLVATVNDFGSRGDKPTHPELLEWLASRFESEGKRLKSLHRLIVLSDAYARSSTAENSLVEADPDNRLWGRASRRRLSAEELRDTLLVVADRLDRSPGGPHPFPPASSWTFTQHNPFAAVYENRQRGVYQMVQRQRRHPFFALFDGADPNASTGMRQVTTVPTQSLFFFNDPFFHEQATALAQRLLELKTPQERLDRLYAIALQRAPTESDRQWANRFLADYPGEDLDRWSACCRLLLASNEFLHLD